jgi:hypothetical protein
MNLNRRYTPEHLSTQQTQQLQLFRAHLESNSLLLDGCCDDITLLRFLKVCFHHMLSVVVR